MGTFNAFIKINYYNNCPQIPSDEVSEAPIFLFRNFRGAPTKFLSELLPARIQEMIKHSRKRQKLDNRQPLGSSNRTAAASEKDDEERRLEELIFGVPFVPSAVNTAKSRTELVGDDDEGEGIHSTGKEMDGLLDSDVRFLSFPFVIAHPYVDILCR